MKTDIRPIKIAEHTVGYTFSMECRGMWPWWKNALYKATFRFRKCDTTGCWRRAWGEMLFGGPLCRKHFSEFFNEKAS